MAKQVSMLLGLLALGGFVWLAFYSLGKEHAVEEHKLSRVSEFVRRLEADAKAVSWRWKNKEAAQVAELWNVTPEEVGEPVQLFRKGR
jgi:hypothetical protein